MSPVEANRPPCRVELVTHDGEDEPNENATNLEFMRWRDATSPLGLAIDTNTGDPRS